MHYYLNEFFYVIEYFNDGKKSQSDCSIHCPQNHDCVRDAGVQERESSAGCDKQRGKTGGKIGEKKVESREGKARDE